VTVYRLLDGGGAELLSLRRLQPSLRGSPLGAVYAPPTLSGPTLGPGSGWQDGTYIFRIGGSTSEPLARWLGVRVQILPPPDGLTDQNPGSAPR
jgi:hypothetical protein